MAMSKAEGETEQMPGRQSPSQNRSALWQGKIYEKNKKSFYRRINDWIRRNDFLLRRSKNNRGSLKNNYTKTVFVSLQRY